MSYLVVGLGNPGLKYSLNRHNIGYMVVDHLIGIHTSSNISKKTFHGELFRTSDIYFLKPTTFMNNSGLSVKAVRDFFKIDNVIVIHDDIDLDFGVIKVKFAGGHGGHNGLKSIDTHIGREYTRIRVGISKNGDASSHVLKDFSKLEQSCFMNINNHCEQILEALQNNIVTEVSAKYNTKEVCKK